MSRKHKPSLNTLIDIVIPFWKGYDYLYKCLSHIPEAIGDKKYKIIIVDNGNEINDTHKEFFGTTIKQLPVYEFTKIVRTDENLGYPGGVNLGVKKGFSPFIFILTIDVFCTPNSISHALDEIMNNSSVGVVGMKLLFPLEGEDRNRPRGKLQHIGLHTNIRGEIVHTFIGWSSDNPRVNRIRSVLAVTGAAFLTRRMLWTEIGGLFEGYGKGTYEDVDFCLSARQLGYDIIVDKEAVAYHEVGVSVTKFGERFPLNENQLIFLHRWGSRLPYTEYLVV